jgi:hypothetical protein
MDSHEAMHKFLLSHGKEVFRTANVIGQVNYTFHRAWCLQEQILAKIIVHFTGSEMIWECLEDVQCECNGVNQYKGNAMESLRTYRGILRKAAWNELRKSPIRKQVLAAWWSCVEQYSVRSLTDFRDKLPAISRLAQEMPTGILGNYSAGIWEYDLPTGLL